MGVALDSVSSSTPVGTVDDTHPASPGKYFTAIGPRVWVYKVMPGS